MIVVVPPKAAEREPVSNPSAITAPPDAKPLGARLVEMAMSVDAAGQDQLAAGVDDAVAAGQSFGQRGDAAAADADIASRYAAGGGDGAALDHQIECAHVINPSPRFAQKVMRCSATAKIAYMTMPRIAITNRPANTSGVSKLEVAAIIR